MNLSPSSAIITLRTKTHRDFLTQTCLHSKQSWRKKTLVSSRPPSLSCHTRTQANMLACVHASPCTLAPLSWRHGASMRTIYHSPWRFGVQRWERHQGSCNMRLWFLKEWRTNRRKYKKHKDEVDVCLLNSRSLWNVFGWVARLARRCISFHSSQPLWGI